ncbi:MAG: UbiX family flavin prenyltransferase [Clostridiales bacterium]|nr:UbiX family flavin prenyltransferase [Clostridiales bacterium]
MRIIVGVTGASGVEMSYYLMKALREAGNTELFLIVSEGARLTWELESSIPLEDLYALADHVEENRNLASVISSGSFVTDGMIVMPCSMKTLAGIVSGYADNLISRAADVCMKEGRRLVLVPRETPLSRLHLRNLKEAADLGCAIVPPMLTFYNQPQTMENQIYHVVGKVLLQFGISCNRFRPWNGRDGHV